MKDDVSTVAPRDHFSAIVPKWSHFGPPLRPSPDDSAVMQRVASGLSANARVAVLGLTPEIIGCVWPQGARLTAIDHSPGMIAQLWPPENGPPDAQVSLAEWTSMPLASSSIDCVAGDGCYIVLSHPDGYAALTREVCRVLRPGGFFVIRVFLRPDNPETIADISDEFCAGHVGSVHALKLRLLAAVHGASGQGSRLGDVWQAWQGMPALPTVLHGKRGWTPEEVVGIESYGGMQARYYLPTLDEFRGSLDPSLRELECAFGHYELAQCCPTLTFERV